MNPVLLANTNAHTYGWIHTGMPLDLFINTMAGATHIHGTAGGGGCGVCGGTSLAIYRENGHLIRDRAKQSQATV